jgi:hypothetical protein
VTLLVAPHFFDWCCLLYPLLMLDWHSKPQS